ncbi:MAG: hypothetical protein DDT33_01493 [Firmicutes bacterium]|nr:hypothetical protein [Bacillota bacterium]
MKGFVSPTQASCTERVAYSYKEVAVMLGISLAQIQRMVTRGVFQTVPLGPRRKRILRSSLDAFLATGKSPLTKDTL